MCHNNSLNFTNNQQDRTRTLTNFNFQALSLPSTSLEGRTELNKSINKPSTSVYFAQHLSNMSKVQSGNSICPGCGSLIRDHFTFHANLPHLPILDNKYRFLL